MERRMLIAQIGKGSYRPTNYAVVKKGYDDPSVCELDETSKYKTGYTFEAVLHELQREKKIDIDTVVLIGTVSSYWGSLVRGYLESGEADQEKKADEDYWTGRLRDILGDRADLELDTKNLWYQEKHALEYYIHNISTDREVLERTEAFLSEAVQNKLGCSTQVRIVILRKGIAHNEMEENFDLLQSGIERVVAGYENPEHIDVYFDISNGFRSLPMYIYSFTNYLTRIRKENYRLYMYYGMGDAIEAYGSTGERYAPMVELSEVTDLMQWINAVNEFRNFGSVRELQKIFREHEEWDIEVKGGTREKLSDVFAMFDYATNAHNLKVLEDEIESICSMNFHEEGETRIPRQAQLLLDDIGKDFRRRFQDGQTPYRFSRLTIKLAEWFYEQDRNGSAAIALMEGMTTYVMERFEDEVRALFDIKENKTSSAGLAKQLQAAGLSFEGAQMTDWLFDNTRDENKHSIREKVRYMILRANLRSDGQFIEEYRKMGQNIRNISAHILYQDVAPDDVKEYRRSTKYVLDKVLEDMKVTDDKNSVFSEIIKGEKRKQNNKKGKKNNGK